MLGLMKSEKDKKMKEVQVIEEQSKTEVKEERKFS